LKATYSFEVYHSDQQTRVDELESAIRAEVRSLGVHRSVTIVVSASPAESGPTVGVYLGSALAAGDSVLGDRIVAALRRGTSIIPVVDSLENYTSSVPFALKPLNGWEWTGATPARSLARRLLEEVGIEDKRRRAFISHKREDGLAAAEQLHDFPSDHGFEAFVDRFGIRSGSDVQERIADALEECAFLLLLETPLAHTSDWVFDEVEYAQSHLMGMHIVTWPGVVAELPATNRWPRQALQVGDLEKHKGYDVFTENAMDAILSEVEAIHANTIVRRRRYLLRSVEDAARSAGLACTPSAGWRLLVQDPAKTTLVQVSSRRPTVEELYALDGERIRLSTFASGVLVHSARTLPKNQRDVLAWAAGARDLTLVPENAVGALWKR
jgi:hypothetical protein